mgnify:CR=1 FL=1|nr:MAG TPA: PORTAL PROTEIN [Caudoviricetes sp.]
MTEIYPDDGRLVNATPAPTRISGLPDDDKVTFLQLWQKWQQHSNKNKLLSVYYDGHRAFQDLGISIPPQMTRTKAALGWPQKVVTMLARRHVFEGYSLNGAPDAFEANEILSANNYDLDLTQAITSAYKHSFSLLTVTRGDETIGEPPVVVQARDAEWSAALWDTRRRTIEAALTIDQTDKYGQPTGAIMHTTTAIWRIDVKENGGGWKAEKLGDTPHRIFVEALCYDPQLNRPLGHSRITREVRYLTDAAVRTMVRAETSAEFFSSPQRYVLGAERADFAGQDRWSAIMARVQVLEPNENGDIPSVGQFSQMTMSPHLEMYRQLAQNLCAATNLPQSAIGVFAENPASAEAMQAAEAALADEAEYQWRIFTAPLRRTLQNIIMVRDKLDEPPAESWKTSVKWTPSRYSSPSSAADFAVKMVSAFPSLQESQTLMRRAGLTEDDLADINAENRKKNAVSLLDRALAATNNENIVDENGENAANSDASNNDSDNADNAGNNNSGNGNGSNLNLNNAPNTRNRVKRNIKLPGGTKTPIG